MILNINMDNNTFHYFGYGALIGMTQTIIGHPFDTLKTIKQSNISVTKKDINFKRLFLGIKFPLTISTGFNSGIFGIHTYFLNKDMSHATSGFLAGGIMGLLSNPFEYYKINSQLNKPFNYYQIWKGCGYTISRESIATSYYFSSYNYYTNEHNITPFIAGGISGCSSWLITYPIDTIKTIKQSNDNINLKQIWKIINNKNFNIWNGILICQIRAFIVNGISFVLYEHLKK